MLFYPDWFTLHRQTTLCFENPPHSYVDESDIDYPNRVDLMQFTGKKDVGDKEIYESDLVRDRMTGKVFEVIFQKLCWRLGGGGELLGNYASTEEDLEVIGNIHENPELLK